jgi:hypothetical protein
MKIWAVNNSSSIHTFSLFNHVKKHSIVFKVGNYMTPQNYYMMSAEFMLFPGLLDGKDS